MNLNKLTYLTLLAVTLLTSTTNTHAFERVGELRCIGPDLTVTHAKTPSGILNVTVKNNGKRNAGQFNTHQPPGGDL